MLGLDGKLPILILYIRCQTIMTTTVTLLNFAVGRDLSYWDWVRDLDELSRSMREKIVFWGFREGAIQFPPSYRWKRGGDPGDYTDAAYLQSYAYTTSVDELNISEETQALDHMESLGSHSLSRQGSSEIEHLKSTGGGKASSKRTPSYTDRILSHSLPGRADRLSWRHYDIADAVRLSDHRPVAATLEMLVSGGGGKEGNK